MTSRILSLLICSRLCILWFGLLLFWEFFCPLAAFGQHPRVLVTPSELQAASQRMYGPQAREPYLSWFERVRQREESAQSDASQTPSLMSLALLFTATNDSRYRDWYLAALDSYMAGRVSSCRSSPESRCGPSFDSLVSMDIMWGDIPDSTKLNAFEATSAINAFYWHSGANQPSQNFGYHGAHGRAPAFAFAAMFSGESILSHPDVVANPTRYSFNVAQYINAIAEELSPTGNFWRIENRIAGDPTYNTALPGDYGGMYDNFGYDSGEEAWSIYVVSAYSTFSGQDRLTGFLHDTYRGRFWQNFEIPHTETTGGSGENEYTTRRIEQIWNTQTDWNTSPNKNTLALVASKYQDPYMQYYADRWRKVINTYSYDYYTTAIWWMLLFYDDSLSISPPSTNPTSRYFSGPGLVSMRENWSKDAAFAVFIAGEGISRRYEDGNSFVLYRKGPIVVHAGARIRANYDNNKHHWYHIRSISKNTMKIFDPNESFDVDREGRITALHTGTPLVNSDNMGGQLFESGVSTQDGTYDGAREYRSSAAFDLGIWNTADIRKYEHLDGNFTYAMGDATDAYVRKIEFFEREFVYLRPDVFVLFDRVRSVNRNFRKSWTIHTVDTPTTSQSTSATAQGMRQYEDLGDLTIANQNNVTSLHVVLPTDNQVTVRGGDTILTTGRPLRSGVSIGADHIQVSETPRWLEIFAVGNDSEGSLTLYGDAEEGQNTSETITFNGTVQIYQGTTYGFSIEGSTLTDTDQNWTTNQWAEYMLRCHGGSNPDLRIVSNTRTTLTVSGTLNPSGVWAYSIVRPVANSYLHWTRITQVTTSDMNVDNLTISIPHYFDATDANGKLYSFSPHTDSRDDGYRKRTDLGQWTVEIEPTVPRSLDNFLTVFSLRDPQADTPAVHRIEAASVAGAVIGDRLILFAKDRSPLSSAQFPCPATGRFRGLIANLQPSTTYYYRPNGSTIELSTQNIGGQSSNSSPMGVLQATINCTGDAVAPSQPMNLRIR